LFRERIETGRILERHGDLRPEHICLKPEIAIIDCLEFSRDLRIVDTADDLAFSALECERLGATDSADLLLNIYSEISGDLPNIALVHFYKSCRGSLRAAIFIRHLTKRPFDIRLNGAAARKNICNWQSCRAANKAHITTPTSP
jgi:aminoglycoside phosphotransferase family enzyme